MKYGFYYCTLGHGIYFYNGNVVNWVGNGAWKKNKFVNSLFEKIDINLKEYFILIDDCLGD